MLVPAGPTVLTMCTLGVEKAEHRAAVLAQASHFERLVQRLVHGLPLTNVHLRAGHTLQPTAKGPSPARQNGPDEQDDDDVTLCVDSDGAPTSGYILRAGLPRGGVGGGGGGHDERAEEDAQHVDTPTTSGALRAQRNQEELGPSVLQPHRHISETKTRARARARARDEDEK
ncbi:hypothetical protein EYF80_058687 [Liparis tanakae]|uniref:Uncharacterized protein n=1 Tax=Liparis tanakae TaxID=230148 RepID=A0A4Z2ESA7_9TELE|nr:hypothetical protein EYF80_058687 [Liparis tanakae]